MLTVEARTAPGRSAEAVQAASDIPSHRSEEDRKGDRMDKQRADFIPALRYGALTALYDPLLRWTMRESLFKDQLIRRSRNQTGSLAPDLGWGPRVPTPPPKKEHLHREDVGFGADAQACAPHV